MGGSSFKGQCLCGSAPFNFSNCRGVIQHRSIIPESPQSPPPPPNKNEARTAFWDETRFHINTSIEELHSKGM